MPPGKAGRSLAFLGKEVQQPHHGGPACCAGKHTRCVRKVPARALVANLDALDSQEKSAKDVEKEQEAMLMAKYGGLKPKKKLLPKASQRG